jgi:hypothetical protein
VHLRIPPRLPAIPKRPAATPESTRRPTRAFPLLLDATPREAATRSITLMKYIMSEAYSCSPARRYYGLPNHLQSIFRLATDNHRTARPGTSLAGDGRVTSKLLRQYILLSPSRFHMNHYLVTFCKFQPSDQLTPCVLYRRG